MNNILCFIVACLILTTLSAGIETKDENSSLKNDNLICSEAIEQILTPEFMTTLTSIFMNSGTNINDLGSYETCKSNPDLHYVLIATKAVENDYTILSLGVCAPNECKTHEDFQPLTQAVQGVASLIIPPETIYTEANFPEEILNAELDWKAYLMISVIAILIVLLLAGLLVQFTDVGDKPNLTQQEKSTMKVEERKTKLALAYYCFSPANNIVKLFTISSGGDQTLAILNGVRVLSIGWVILGHSFNFYQIAPIANIFSYGNILKSPLFALVPGGVYAVDTFFFLSGFLTFYLLTSKIFSKNGKCNYLMLVFHRYYRLIFPIMFVQFFTMSLVKYFGDGPVYFQNWEVFCKLCDKYWWSNLLFINNFYPHEMDKQCIGWVWYLANDFQFFLITPPILILFYKNRKLGYALTFALLLVNFIVNGVMAGVFDVGLMLDSAKINGEDWMYAKPWSRMGAYLVGGIFGLSYLELKFKDKYPIFKNSLSNLLYSKLQNSLALSTVCFVVGVGITALYVFPIKPYMNECNMGMNCWSLWVTVPYNMTSKPFFVLGVGLIIAPALVNRLPFLKFLLGSEIFTVMARLTYMVYMIHIVVIMWVMFDTRQAYYVSELNGYWSAFAAFLASYLFAIPVTLLCEVPFMNLEKYVLFPGQLKVKKPSKPETELEHTDPLLKPGFEGKLSDNSEENTHDSKQIKMVIKQE